MENEAPVITMSQTKKEMLEAYNRLKKKLKEVKAQSLDPEALKAQLKKEAAEEAAQKMINQCPTDQIKDLQKNITTRLNEITEKLGETRSRYLKLCEAAENKKNELEKIYEVETSAEDLAALIEAHREKKSTLEWEISERKSEWVREQEMKGKERKREQEEYDYALKRQREQQKNALEDEFAKLEQELKEKRQGVEKEFMERKTELDERDRSIGERERNMESLEQQVNGFPQELEQRVGREVEEATARLRLEYEHKLSLQEKQFEGDRNVFENRIAGLEKLVESLRQQVGDLSRLQEQAYEKVQDIATRAVEKSGSIVSMPHMASPLPAKEENNR